MKTKILIIASFLLIFAFAVSVKAEAVTRVRGYFKPSTGTYVPPHYKTSPDSSKFNNYSTKGNINPYTGKKGTVNPLKINTKR